MRRPAAALCVLLILSLCSACGGAGAETDDAVTGDTPVTYDAARESVYHQYAHEATRRLLENYWDESGGIFYDAYPQKRSDAFNYWWYAHAIDLMADAYIRTGDSAYLSYADRTVDTITAHNHGITNDYYDDMEWMALALLRLYDATGEERYLDNVHILWEDILGGWNDIMGGGIAWRKEQPYYKNTPANAPAAILAARLYASTGDTEALHEAERIYAFVRDNLVDRETGQVWDGINRENNGYTDKGWNFTYNHGVYIGAGVALYLQTGNAAYLDDAKATAEYALSRFVDKRGVFVSEGDGDGGLFRGILIRYLAELYRAAPELTGIRDVILQNADTLYESGRNDIWNFAGSFGNAPKDGAGYDLSIQLSGCMLLEAAAGLD